MQFRNIVIRGSVAQMVACLVYNNLFFDCSYLDLIKINPVEFQFKCGTVRAVS